jgi:polyisoprenoid-binding protein YceI
VNLYVRKKRRLRSRRPNSRRIGSRIRPPWEGALVSVLILIAGAVATAQERAIDVQRSTITVHVGRAGLFSAAGHDHWIHAPIASGILNDSENPRVEFRVEASKLEVKPDPKVDASTQAEIQKDMQELTLESRRYPEIVFRSTRVEKMGQSAWSVEGQLTLHGVTKPVSARAERKGNAYLARATIKQTDFGIKPVSAAGGLVKVKDQVEIDFEIVPVEP